MPAVISGAHDRLELERLRSLDVRRLAIPGGEIVEGFVKRTTSNRRVFVVGAFIPNGGTYMAYHLGAILHEMFGFECLVLNVGAETPDHGIFSYPHDFSSLPYEEMSAVATSEDLLIANPSFSEHLLGLRFPGTKLSYIQGYNTYPVLDCFFDHYVACSSFVRDYVRLVYGIDAPVIPPFIHTDLVQKPTPWEARDARAVLVIGKAQTKAFLDVTIARLQERHAGIALDFHTLNGPVSHRNLLRRMQEHRYVLSLSAAEGFGLMPLEAMLCECTVIGFHAHGGKDYMEPGQNCEAVGYPDFDGMVDGLALVVRDVGLARRLADRGRRTALQYGLDIFRMRWRAFFQEVMGI